MIGIDYLEMAPCWTTTAAIFTLGSNKVVTFGDDGAVAGEGGRQGGVAAVKQTHSSAS